MDYDTLLNLVPVGILALTFGATFAAGVLFKSPWWLDAFPYLFGGAFGSAHYFLVTDAVTIAERGILLNIVAAVILGGIYGGVETLLWRKWAKKFFSGDAPQPPTVPPLAMLLLVGLLCLGSASSVQAQTIGVRKSADTLIVRATWPAATDTIAGVSSNRWTFVSVNNWSASVGVKVIFNASPTNYVWVPPGGDLNKNFYCRSVRYQTEADTAIISHFEQ